MRKLFMFAFAVVAVMAFTMAPIYACGGEKASTAKAECSKTDAKTISSTDKASCSASKTSAKLASDKASCGASNTSAQLASDKAACASKASAKLAGDKAACAATCAEKGMSQAHAEMCAKMCPTTSEVRVVSIEGMTCGGCESSISATLAKAPGVIKVINVSYQDGIALVAVDKNKVCTKTMAKMVTDKGYKAEVLPAVATTTTDETAKTDTKGSM